MVRAEYQHQMMKEISEGPHVVKETLTKEQDRVRKVAQEIKSLGFEMMYITGSGTSYHAGLASQYALSNLTNLMTSIISASEFARWIPTKVSRRALLMAISQSGESSDVLEAVEAALDRGMSLLAVTNTPESKLARMSNYQLLPRSGRELAVPATKTYVTQLTSIFMLSIELADEDSGVVIPRNIRAGLNRAPQMLQESLRSLDAKIRNIAERYREKNFMFLLGSGPNYATALEGALKLKETSTIFAEGFATREFLHGPMRLVDERTVVITIVSPDEVNTYLDLIRSLRNFGAPVISISEYSDDSVGLVESSDETLLVPSGLPKVFSPILYVVPLQLLAYHSSVVRGLNPDKPEKLTKVVKQK